MNNRDLFIYAQTKKSKRTLSETKSTLKSLIDRSITSIDEFQLHEITEIGVRAFSDCKNLLYANIPDSVTAIGVGAFYNCENLNVTIEDGLTVGENAFYGCSNVSMVTDTKPSYTLDANDTFYGCDGLTVFIPEGDTIIAEEAFKGCEVIKEVVTSNSVTEIQTKAFMDCSHLKKATIATDSATEFKLLMGTFSQCYNLEEVTLPSTIKVINAYTFYKNYNLKTINIPDNLIRIETGAFFQCNSLTNITLPSGVQYLRNQAFYNCSGLTGVTIPNSVISFGTDAFSKCSNLENVVLESGFNASDLDLSASTLYSVNTLVAMLNALANRTGQVPYTLTLGSTNLAKLSNEQLAIATEKNWTLA